jgi:hypothetical protein
MGIFNEGQRSGLYRSDAHVRPAVATLERATGAPLAGHRRARRSSDGRRRALTDIE